MPIKVHLHSRVRGFRFSGIPAGIKTGGVPDLALIYSEVPAVVSGCFTTNRVQAAPVLVSKKNIRSGLCRAVMINSGNANACTGARGLRDAAAMVQTTARLLRVPAQQVLVCSTGKIGVPLPINKILEKIPEVVRTLSTSGLTRCARAILTTDKGIKVAAAAPKVGGRRCRIVGFAKGAGMIEPHMVLRQGSGHALRRGSGHATMLAFILTDACIEKGVLDVLTRNCVGETFNRITVDGDTSTNDTALVLASGLAGNRPFKLRTPNCRRFADGLWGVMDSLARQMVADGEGATKCVRIEVRGGRTNEEARRVAYTVGNSPLVKTSFFGEDPNWGRIMGALGRSGATLDPARVTIYYDGVCVVRGGVTTGPVQERKAKKAIKKENFTVCLDLHQGRGSFHVYASDLTLDYVKLNSCYRT